MGSVLLGKSTMSTDRLPSVLLVDDDAALLRALGRTLARDFTMSTATSGYEALNLLRIGRRFDVIVSDVGLPDLQGHELFREILAFDPTQARRVIFLTGGGLPRPIEKFLRAHVVLVKGGATREIAEAIRTMAITSRPSDATCEPSLTVVDEDDPDNGPPTTRTT
jgi:CheY-like chemotaxis protein